MMYRLIDRPSPMRSPVGLVVKRRLEQFYAELARNAVPLSRTRISTSLQRSRVVTFSVGEQPSPLQADACQAAYKP
jgi:hypothetical protein